MKCLRNIALIDSCYLSRCIYMQKDFLSNLGYSQSPAIVTFAVTFVIQGSSENDK